MSSQWFFLNNGKLIGPFSIPELQLLAASGQLHPNHLIGKRDITDWVPASEVAGVFAGEAQAAGPTQSSGDVAPAPSAAGQASASTAALPKRRRSRLEEGRWFYLKNGRRVGPFSPVELETMAATGQLVPADSVRKEGMPEWMPAAKISGLFAASASVTASARKAAVVREGRPRKLADWFWTRKRAASA